MRLLALFAVLALAAAAATTAFVLTQEGTPAFTGAVTTLGDSLNVGIEPYLASELEGWDLRHHNRGGKRTQEGLDELIGLDEPLAPVLVVSLGTNDHDGDLSLFRSQVEAILDHVGRRRCVVWSTLWLDGPLAEHNDVLREAARSHGNLELDDWSGLVESQPELLAFDRIHGSLDGYAARAARITRIVKRCYPRPAEPTQ